MRRRRTRRVRRRGPAPRDDARIGAVWPPGYGVRLVSDTAAVLRTGALHWATPPGRGPCVPDGSHGHAVGPWRRAGVAVPHLALISLEAASRSSRRVKTVVSSHRYDPRIGDYRCETRVNVDNAAHMPTWAAPHGIFNVPPYDRATSRISTSVQYVYRRAPPASARAPAEPRRAARAPAQA